MIRRSRFTILPNIVRCRRDLAKTSAWSSCPIGRGPFGYLAIPRPRSQTLTTQLRVRGRCGQASTLMYALSHASFTHIFCGNYAAVNAQLDEAVTLAAEKSALAWKAFGMMHQGLLLALTGQASNAAQIMTSGINAWRSTGSTLWIPWYLPNLARAYAELGQFDNASRCIGEAMTTIQTTKERWCEAEVNRIAGEIALKSPQPVAAKAEAYFERALAVARQQQAKSWELRAAMSLARLWRDQGKVQQARELLAPVYGWFTEGFDTRDLKEAKALLEELASWRHAGSFS